jgi:hypothetical protein
VHYGPAGYYRAGAVYPRDRLRDPYPEVGRDAAGVRVRLMVTLESPRPVVSGRPPCQCLTGTDSRAAAIAGADGRAAGVTGTDSRAASVVGRFPQCEC